MIDCLAEGLWIDVMTKPLQAMAFGTMKSKLVNCLVNYEDPPKMAEDGGTKKEMGMCRMGETKQTLTIAKMVTWKRVIATPFRTPQECVGKSEGYSSRVVMDRHLRSFMHHRVRILSRNTMDVWRGKD